MRVGCALLAASFGLLACAPAGETTGSSSGVMDTDGGGPSAACDALVTCVADFDPTRHGEALARYGLGGSCWNSDAVTQMLCDDECKAGLGGVFAENPDAEVCDPTPYLDDDGGPTQRWADILFVVDNGPGSGGYQGRLAQAAAALTDALDAGAVDYRIGVTTADMGSPACAQAGDDGQLRLSSCRQRLDAFAADGVDASAEACLDVCTSETLTVTPTPIVADGSLAPRPWLESTAGMTNVDVPMAQALACALPQGIEGCRFSSPLQAARQAITDSLAPGSPGEGFFRQGESLLVVIILTDDVDCSWSDPSIFEPGGDRAFWSDADAAAPTPAVCWNAGVSCTGGPGAYSDCAAADFARDGSPAGSPETAVLLPVAGFVDAIDPQTTIVSAIAGVPLGYSDGTVPIAYADDDDPERQLEYGIGAGCTTAGIEARPPVRMRALFEQLEPDGPSMSSICRDSYETPVAALAGKILAKLPAPP